MAELLKVTHLETRFRTHEGTVHAVNGISFALDQGEVLGIVGESGCGKSVAMLSILGLVPRPPGEVRGEQAVFHDQDLLRMSKEELRRVRGAQIGMIFQDPMTSLNPVLTIGRQVAEPLIEHVHLQKNEARERVVELFGMVGIPDARRRINEYPHQFSGGMRQRVMIAMALACQPQLIIADEPTTALDVTIQAQITDMVRGMQAQWNSTAIWITHDLGVVAGLAQRVLVMYAGCIIEEAPVDTLFRDPQHPYTIGLLGSLPRLDETGRRRLASIEGFPPVLYNKPECCPFLPRCRLASAICETANPALADLGEGHRVACFMDPATGKERQ